MGFLEIYFLVHILNCPALYVIVTSYMYIIHVIVHVLTTACGKPSVKSMKASLICECVLVVLKSLLDLPSLFLIPSILKPNVAVDEIVSRHTMYLQLNKTKV